jgi:hypothetical protein
MANESWISKNKWIVGIGLGVVITGVIIYINRSSVKTVLKETFGGQDWFDTSLSWWRDVKTKGIIEKLHPKFKDKASEFFARVEKEKGLRMIGISGLRTFEEQAKLKKDNASNASPGMSDHNYGAAIDVNVIDPKTGKNILMKASSKADWEKSGIPALAKSMGMIWGGDAFSGYYDPVHFAYQLGGMKGSQLLALHNAGKIDSDGYVIV